jgi:hypothetical protein
MAGKMKTPLLMSGLLCLSLAMPLLAAEDSLEVSKGDTIATVVEKLGRPAGVISGGPRITYSYDQGTVDFISGRVERVFLQTKNEVRQQKAREQSEENKLRGQIELDRLTLSRTGQAALTKALTDLSKTSPPAPELLEFWTQFKKQYPYTDVGEQITKAKEKVKLEQREQERTTELATLNERTGIIEKRLIQLDAEYAASLTHWKRAEIVAERARLNDELATIKDRTRQLGIAQ